MSEPPKHRFLSALGATSEEFEQVAARWPWTASDLYEAACAGWDWRGSEAPWTFMQRRRVETWLGLPLTTPTTKSLVIAAVQETRTTQPPPRNRRERRHGKLSKA